MSELNVALITPWKRQGGIATYSAQLVASLDEQGVEVTPVPIEKTGSSNPLNFTDLISHIPSSADVVHVQFEAGLFGKLGMSGTGAPAFFLTLSRIDQPVITTLHEVHSDHAHRGPLGDRLLQMRDFTIEQLALRASDAIIVHTQHAREVLQGRHGTDTRIERMLHPADGDADPIPKETAKEELGVDGPMLLTFGFVEKKKRYQDVIRVLPDLPEATYVIAGGFREDEGEELVDDCRDLAAELCVADRVQFTGYVNEEEVPVLFGAADVVVLPYNRVSQSGVVNDALSYQRPVVASALPAFEELREEFGCVLTYEGTSELVSALEAGLYDNHTCSKLQNAAATYIGEVNWGSFSSRTKQLFTDLASAKCSCHSVENHE